MGIIMRNFIRKSFKRELLLCFLVVALLPLIICNVFMVLSFQEKIQRDYEKEATNQLQIMESAITDVFLEFQTVGKELSQNENVIESLYIKDTELKKGIYVELYKVTARLRENAQFHLYSKGGICKYSTDNAMLGTMLPTYWGILRAASESRYTLVIRNVEEYTAEAKGTLLRTAQAITDRRGNCIGYVVIDMKSEHFDSLLNGTYNVTNSIMVLDQYWNSIYSTEVNQNESMVPLLRNQVFQGKSLKEIEDGSRCYVTKIGETGLVIVLKQREIFTSKINNTMYSISIMMALVSLIFCVAVALGFSRSLTNPINKLTNAMREVENGNLEVRIDLDRQDEIGRLSEDFNQMTKELKDFMISQVKQQQELNESNIARMQAQLNPHFLYNTLDTMKWVAKANHVPEIATLSSSLAKILTISISEEQFIPLKEEMELVKCYVDIQRIRFSDKFEYEANLPKELEECIVPKLVIQPLVENAIIHGLVDRDSGQIKIDIERIKNQLILTVSDDGCGIEKERMEQINRRDRNKLTGHLGIYNVDTIIRLHYGQKYGLHVSAIDTGGTKVIVTLPLWKGDSDAKSYSS